MTRNRASSASRNDQESGFFRGNPSLKAIKASFTCVYPIFYPFFTTRSGDTRGTRNLSSRNTRGTRNPAFSATIELKPE